jgi:lipoyl(octanoyl) transferase
MFLTARFLGSELSYHEGMQQMYAAMQYPNQLLLLEHKDTITKTRLHKSKNILFNDEYIKSHDIEIVETDRGGDVTFHGLGQLVGYPIIKLPKINNAKFEHHVDFHSYIKNLEQALLKFCISIGLNNAYLIKEHTGIWVKNYNENPKKLIAIGVGISKGITKHGFALNIYTDLAKFQKFIIPCGISTLGVTSLEKEFLTRQKPIPNIYDICNKLSYFVAQQFNLGLNFAESFIPKITMPKPCTESELNVNPSSDFNMGALNG